MPLRPLLLALLSALAVAALLAGPVSPALADAAAPQCVLPGGGLAPAPAGVPDGAPCPPADQQSPDAAPADPAPAPSPAPAEEPQPQPEAPAQAPAQAPAPDQASTQDPATDEPVAGTPEQQTVEQNPTKSKSRPKVETKHGKRVPDRRRSGHERSTGPDDSAPPPPPASLLDGGPGLSPAPAGSGGAATGLSGGPGPSGPISLPAPLTRGVPNILLDSFRIPPFLLPIYQAAGVQYGVRWEILAAINAIETDYGRNLSVSTAGAVGWMQFMPGTWQTYGVDANGDGRRDPYNPVDAIFAAARYLKAAGAGQSLRRAIFAYNHADWYVNDVLDRARQLSAMPADVVASLSGLTLGRFPVAAPATYAGRLRTRGRAALRPGAGGASISVGSSATRRAMRIYAAAGAPVVAVQDARVVSMGVSARLGRYIRLRDAYGNTYTYGHLAKLATRYPVPRERTQSERSIRRELGLDGRDPKPTAAATRAGRQRARTALADDGATPEAPASGVTIGGRPAREVAIRRIRVALGLALPDLTRNRTDTGEVTTPTPSSALPGPDGMDEAPVVIPQLPVLHPDIGSSLPQAPAPAAAPAAPAAQDDTIPVPAGVTAFRAYFSEPKALDRRDVVLKRLRRGAHVIGGTVLGRIGAASLRWSGGADPGDARAARATAARLRVARAPHVLFEVRPAGKATPRVDPKPLLDGWRLLDSTNIFRARNPLVGEDAAKKKLSIGQIMLMSKEQLMRHVLENPDISIYECGRADIRAGIIDRRVLATLEFLVARGMKPTVTSLNCGHGFFTAGGNVSEHSSGDAVDIAAINGVPIVGHQGAGSITDKAVRQLLTLQGTMKPHQIITLMQYAGTDNTFAMADHYDHIHVGFHPNGDTRSVLKPGQWVRLLSGLERVRNPVVPVQPSRFAIKVTKRAPAGAKQSRQGRRAPTGGAPRARDG